MARDASDVRHHETISAWVDGEEVKIWNFLNVTPAYQFRGGNPVRESFPSEHRIEVGGGHTEPEYVTEWVAEEVYADLSIDLWKRDGIEVVDVEDEEVELL